MQSTRQSVYERAADENIQLLVSNTAVFSYLNNSEKGSAIEVVV